MLRFKVRCESFAKAVLIGAIPPLMLAWIQWKRRLLVRWEYYAHNFLGFVQLASVMMLLKRF